MIPRRRIHHRRLLLASLSFLHTTGIASSVETASTTPSRVPTTSQTIRIDGVLDETAWEQALLIELNYEVEPGENTPAPVRTECLLMTDRSHLYAAFRAFDPDPKAVRAYLSDRDEIAEQDWVGLVLDTFNDQRRAFEFRVNPLGIQADGVFTDDVGSIDFSLDLIWNSEGRRTEWGYVVEMAIPFSALRFQRSDAAQTWGLDAVRYYPRSRKHLLGVVPRDRSNNSYLSQTLKVSGFEGALPGRSIEINPTLTGTRTDEREDPPANTLMTVEEKIDPGMSFRWGITPNSTLNATVNPDFSQVEADARQLDINTLFALYYPEKRPFFVEGADFFTPRIAGSLSSNRAIYTRAIREPAWGVKLTRKQGANTVGAFIVQDDVTNLILPGSHRSRTSSLPRKNLSSAFRFIRNLGQRHTVGVLITDRESDRYFNRLIGFDGYFRVSDTDLVQVQLFGSGTRYPGEIVRQFQQKTGPFYGGLVDLNYRHDTRSLDYWARVRYAESDFRADLGFITQNDFTHVRAGGSYTLNARPGSWYSRIAFFTDAESYRDLRGNLIYRGIWNWFTFHGPFQSFLWAMIGHQQKGYAGRTFNLRYYTLEGSLQPARDLRIGLYCQFGDHVDYANVQAADRLNLRSTLRWNAGKHIALCMTHTYEHLDVSGGRLYRAHIGDATFRVQFSRRLFIRAILQLVDYDYTPALYTIDMEERFKHLFTQFLFSYKVNPRTLLFIGYSDNHTNEEDSPLTRRNRTFFGKIGYALQI